MWVVTQAVNEYDQFGDYLVCVFENKPTQNELKEIIGGNDDFINHLLNGGGRREWEDEWYFLTELKHGEIYIPR
jgi:hypothetical protein